MAPRLHFSARMAFLIGTMLAAAGCAYQFGYVQRDLVGGYKQVAIPVFSNGTSEVGIESFFTNALIRQFNRSQVAKVTGKDLAPVYIEGRIRDVRYDSSAQVDANQKNVVGLPNNTVLTTEYRVHVTAVVSLIRASDKKQLWTGTFNSERVYTAPQVGIEGVNSVNPLYNHSARMEVIELAANDMMADAHDRMTENF